MADCTHNSDLLKLVREGTSQDQRFPEALDPSYAPVDEHGPAYGIVFAQAYAEFLNYYDTKNGDPAGDWRPFFRQDVSAQLAIAAVENVEVYRQQLKEYFAFLNDRKNHNKKADLRNHLDYLFSTCATLAIRLDQLAQNLPGEIPLKKLLQNRIQSQLAPALQRLIGYYKGGKDITDAERPLNDTTSERAAPLLILSAEAVRFSGLITASFSQDWGDQKDWGTFYATIDPCKSVYGELSETTLFERVNHLATHNLFTSIFDQFLKVYARTVSEAKLALQETFKTWDRHEPHYVLFLAFLRLLEHARAEANTLTKRHLDFYYRDILRLKEKPAEPGHAHLVVELAKHVASHELKDGELFKAGKDDLGIEAFFVNDRNFVANQAKVTVLKTVYRHGDKAAVIDGKTTNTHKGRLYASPASNSEDGLGAPLTSVDQSWHPFFNKFYQDGVLTAIKMPKAEIGFALASHYLLMAEGRRTITIAFTIAPGPSAGLISNQEDKDDVICLFTAEKGWFEKTATFTTSSGSLELIVKLTGADPAVVPYIAKTHGYNFATNLPVLLVKLQHRDESEYIYSQLQDVVIQKISLTVDVQGLKTLGVSNDFGPVDISKPFQPFGAQPVNGASFTVGSKEVFLKGLNSVTNSQHSIRALASAKDMFIKGLVSVTLEFEWQNDPSYYQSKTQRVISSAPTVGIAYLNSGKWTEIKGNFDFNTKSYDLGPDANETFIESSDVSGNEPYSTASRNGYVRLVLKGDLRFKQYQTDLTNYLAKIDPKPASHPGLPVLGPFATAVSLTYTAKQQILLDSALQEIDEKRDARFFHVAPFGQAEQHPSLNSAQKVYLLPQFNIQVNKSEAEFYIGVTGLQPPQNLALLFQIADGTADPLVKKPDPHIHWSYLRGNEWVSFAKNEVDDQTSGLLNSGVITFSIPRDASDKNSLLPSGMYWLRVAVAERSEAVCRLIVIAAQGLKATFINKGNEPAFPAKVLTAGTINKLQKPDAAVKKIAQPFATFGGRGAELPAAFYTRISERLRHKDRAITLWDYERLILEAFPQIYKVKCLNHTRYEPNDSGAGIYQELAPGHVTIVTIPNQQFQNARDSLRPFTSVGLLGDIEKFLHKHTSCFAELHVQNPQFEEVWVDCKVRLRTGYDEMFYANKLGNDITRFLSPWAFPGGGRPTFGGKIYKSALIKFVEEQPYVDYVTDFKLFHNIENTSGTGDTDEVEASMAVSILVSVPAAKHIIGIIKPSPQKTPSEYCPCEP